MSSSRVIRAMLSDLNDSDPNQPLDRLFLFGDDGIPINPGLLTAPSSSAATATIAASDASLKMRQTADFVCNGSNDAAQFAAAIAALPTVGGSLALSEGTFMGGIAPSNKNNLTIRGQGAGTILAPDASIAINIQHCSKIAVETLQIADGTVGLNINGASLGRFAGLHINGVSDDGVLINGDSATEMFFMGVFVKDVGGIGWHYARTTVTDTGGVYFTHCLSTKSTAGNSGWKFESSAGSATQAFAWLNQCVCDGFGTDAGFIIDNINDVRSEQLWVVAGSPGHPLVLLNNAHSITFMDPRMYQNSGSGTGVEFAGTTQYVKMRGGALEGVGSAALAFTGGSINDVDIDRSVKITGWTNPTSGIVNSPTGVVAQHKPAGMSPTPSVCVANTIYYAAVNVERLEKIRGIMWHNDATVSGNVLVSLFDRLGNQVAHSVSTAQAGAFLNQRADFTGSGYVAIPGMYFLAYQIDNATGTVSQEHVDGFSGSAAQGSFVIPSSITVPAYTASTKMPALSTY